MTQLWQTLPDKPAIAEHSVHIIGKSLTNSADIAENWLLLSTHEQARALRFKFEIHREQFILAHGYLRQILARYLNCAAAAIEFELGSHGKPYLKDNRSLQFNLSHSHEQMLVAISPQVEIGVDIEQIKPCDATGLAQRFFSPLEWQQLKNLPEPDLLSHFYQIWAQKEAYIKATGLGLSTELQKFSVNAQPAGLIEPKGANWTLQSFTWLDGFTSAFATQQIVQAVNYWRFVS